ncbi:MAG: crossover junction endodeoxyribonuclease RuvC [Bacteroidetes bacterium]|nr:crossover junction endodeoxyribonuclease RuvC [Bacteroidota bacterium]
MPDQDKIILGIDPGTTIMGYGVLHIKGRKMILLTAGVIELHKINDHFTKLKRIFDRVVQLIDEYKPDELAIEAPFYGKNVQSMLKLGRAQGVAISAALSRMIPIFEYAPRKIKMAITGNGNASKEQVAAMLQKILQIKEMPAKLDATDGLAAAVCHHFQNATPLPAGKTYNSWKDFISKNPGRVK